MKTIYALIGILLIIFLTSCALDQATQITKVENPFDKSCSEGPSCLDYVNEDWLEWGKENQTRKEEMIEFAQEKVYDTIQRQFGLEKSEYKLSCVECNTWRGGFINAKGIYQDGSSFELYYHWGWCSSGGTDCGYSMCFSTTSDELFESVKSEYCSEIHEKTHHDGYICKDEAYDNTEQIRNDCLAGEFEQIQGNQKTLSIIQVSNRCWSEAKSGNFNCLEN